MHSVGIDVGSTNVKVALVAPDGTLVGDAGRPLRTDHVGDAVVQDAEQLWAQVATAVREVTAAHPGEAARIGTIGVCSQYSSIVAVDADGTAIGPVLMYLDQRGTDRCWSILERHPEAFATWVERHGIPPIGGGLSLGHLLHLRHDEPSRYERTADHLEVMDLVNLRLTGRAAATQCTMFAAQLCDNRSVGTVEYDPELLRLADLDPQRLPELVPIDGVVGEVTTEVATQLGLPSGVVVRAGMNDTQAGAFATGTAVVAGDRPGGARCGVVVGTTAVLIRPLDRMAVDLDHEVLAMPVPIPGRYVVMAENGIAGRAVERALALLSPDGVSPDERFTELEGALERSPAGAGGVLFLPWLGGSMSPDSAPGMSGGFLGVTLGTERHDLLRASVEGVARNLRWLAPAVDALVGSPTEELVFAGGAARSPGWARTLADVLGLPVAVLERPEVAAARAVGMVALRRAAGDDPTDVGIPIATRFEPDDRSRRVHHRLQPLFEQAFTSLRPVCEALRHE